MTPDHPALNRGMHLRERFRFAFGPQTAGDLVETGFGEPAGGTQQYALPGLFNGEFGAWRPSSRSTYVLGQDDLTARGEPGGFHW
jgi:hypothetical protein